MRFEWDDAKAAANLRKHWVSFDEAAEVFDDPNVTENESAGQSSSEARFVVIGYSSRRMLVVVSTERPGDVIRIISARQPTPSERRLYEERER